MNRFMSVFFRLVPLIMGVICITYGFYVKVLEETTGKGYIVASHVLIALTAICIALFTTAATIIRQLINKYNNFYKLLLPIIGYAVSLFTVFSGVYIWKTAGDNAPYFVSGNIVFAIGLIACCVSTVATASTKFVLITKNEATLKYGEKQTNAFSDFQGKILIAVPAICAIIGFLRGFYLLFKESIPPYFIAAHVVIGLSLICSCLIALVASIVRQIQNIFTNEERWKWSIFVLLIGTINVLWGAMVLINCTNDAFIAPGIVLIGLGLICYSISSKVILLAAVWRREFKLANRIPIIPVVTALICLFLSSYLFEASLFNSAYFVPAHVMVGLGAVCFTLFSIVSILESGTSK